MKKIINKSFTLLLTAVYLLIGYNVLNIMCLLITNANTIKQFLYASIIDIILAIALLISALFIYSTKIKSNGIN